MTLNDLALRLNLKFTDSHLIENAFIHRSYLNESKDWSENNERLEFLGDAVLELATSTFLFQKFPEYQEGMLTNLRASLVKTTSLSQIALKLRLDDLLQMSKGEEAGGGRSNTSLLADCFEAFLGAVYLDLGYESCVSILTQELFGNIESVIAENSYKDNKSILQEIAQAKYHETPKYILISEAGPDHDKDFVMSVKIGDKVFCQGSGKSKQTAQESAARNTLEIIRTN